VDEIKSERERERGRKCEEEFYFCEKKLGELCL
jgi:hypothetical protein